MRCPKCGFISFDHLENCLKCKKDIGAVSGDLFGSTYNLEAPSFLKLQKEKKEDFPEDIGLTEELSYDDDEEEYVDEDLEILMGEEETPGPEVGLGEDDEEEDQEIEIDFSQFENDEPDIDIFAGDEAVDSEDEEEPSLKIEMPEELADLSDLAPPGKDMESDESSESVQAAEKIEASADDGDSDFADLNLDDLDFDLGFDDADSDQEKSSAISEEAVLALDEIDFAETLAESSAPSRSKSDEMDLDLDLDFDLDLGGLSIHKDD